VLDLEGVTDYAAGGFSGPEIFEMTANNFSLIFRLHAVAEEL
jgi:hypothetical protein